MSTTGSIIGCPGGTANVISGNHSRLPFVDKAGLGSRAAHVERNHIVQAKGRAELTQPMTPATGPDSMIETGFAAAASADIVPPLDCMIRNSP